MTISNYLKKLIEDKNKLSTILSDKNINNDNGTFTELIPMVADVVGSGETIFKTNSVKFTGFSGTSLQNTLKYIDTSEQSDMSYMFYNCNNILELDLSRFNTSKVTTMEYMFSRLCAIQTINVSSFNTSSVTNMNSMFGYYSTSYSDTFRQSTVALLPGIENFDTSKVTNMYGMFANCKNLTTLDLSNWDMSNCETTKNMFYGCLELKSVKLGRTSSILTNVSGMFSACLKLEYIDMRNMDLSAVTQSYINNIFNQVPTNCNIVVKDNVAKTLLMQDYPNHNIKTVAELEAE